jgi:hypothetical protein
MPAPSATPPARARAGPGMRSLALLCLVLSALAPTPAAASDAPVELGRLSEVPVWLLDAGAHAGEPAAAVLTADGTMWWLAGGATVRLQHGLGGEQAESCDGAIFAVGGLGRLQRFARTPGLPVAALTGPAVSLLHRPVCLDDLQDLTGLASGSIAVIADDGDLLLLERDARVRARAEGVRALPDAELVLLDLGGDVGPAVAVLADPTQRYRHGVLGDEVEAGSVVLVAIPSMQVVARWAPTHPAVIEERRATAWRVHDAVGLHLTVSDDRRGARLVTLAWDGAELRPIAEAPAVGRARWLHVLAAIDARAYVQHRPHLRGPLVRYEFGAIIATGERDDGSPIPAPPWTASSLDVSSHVIGERNLDRAAWLGAPATGIDLLALPGSGDRSVAWVRCDATACRVLAETPLTARLVTNLVPVGRAGAPTGLLVGDAAGTVWWLPMPSALGR